MNNWIKRTKENLKNNEPNMIANGLNLTWRENKNGEELLVIERSGDDRSFKVFDAEGRYELKGNELQSSFIEFQQDSLCGQKGRAYLVEEILGLKFCVSPMSFLQVNSIQTETLYKKTLEFAALTGKETVFDLYCGIGTMTLLFARHAREVVGIEENPYAVSDAKLNAAANCKEI
jgi:23S rRNA (uracil1939-C5)-methyltransferase